ncbi:MAG: SIS domain-containing protein [Planctomycetota bacterium]
MNPQQLLADNLKAVAELTGIMPALSQPLAEATALIEASLMSGGKLLCCGNGGSAGDAAHFVSEIANRYVLNRKPYPAIDLTADHNILTAVVNDFGIDAMYARQVEALGQADDVVCVFSTSGRSSNIVKAIEAGRSRQLKTIAFLGKGGGACKGLADVELIVPSDVTARVQEMHLMLYHTICEALDPVLAQAGRP